MNSIALSSLRTRAQAFSVALHRLRSDVAETVAEESDVEVELRYLIAALGHERSRR